MAKKTTQFDYEILVRYMLPKGMLDTFEVTNVDEECTGLYDETNTEIRILHIYLDERDLRDDVWHDLKPNGFTEPGCSMTSLCVSARLPFMCAVADGLRRMGRTNC